MATTSAIFACLTPTVNQAYYYGTATTINYSLELFIVCGWFEYSFDYTYSLFHRLSFFPARCCLQIEETYVELLLSLGIRPLVVELRSTAWTSTDDGLYNFRSSYEYFTFLAIYYSQIITRVSYKPNADFTYNWFIDSETRTRTSLLGSPV